MLLSKKNLAISLVLLVLLSLGALGLHQRHHTHRHGFSRRGCSSCVELGHLRQAATRRIVVVVPAARGHELRIIPHSDSCRTARYKSIFSIRPPPAC